ncbi:hypothetical protein [Oerskovia paurometabola]|uniref:hypothetical protein n=1 Tax=Oerskovia paurometabola TaxID=162170 RepID=UPI00380AC1AD
MIRRTLATTAALCLTLLALATPANATTVPTFPPALAAPVVAEPAVTFTLAPAIVVQLLVAFLLPVLVGLVTTRVTSSGRRAWLLAGLTLATSLLVELGRALTAGTGYDVGVALLAALPAFVVSVATHYGLWKPAGVTDAVLDRGRHADVELTAAEWEDGAARSGEYVGTPDPS